MQLLYEHLLEHYDDYNDLNCAERMLQANNRLYNLGLDKYTCKVAAGFGGGQRLWRIDWGHYGVGVAVCAKKRRAKARKSKRLKKNHLIVAGKRWAITIALLS